MSKKVYVLELTGDIESTPGGVSLEIGAVSLDRGALELLKEQKDRELDEYLGEIVDEDDPVTYMNYDLSGPPVWVISEHDLIG